MTKKQSSKQVAVSSKQPTIKSRLARTYHSLLPKRRWLRRVVLILASLLIVSVSAMYGIAQWYIHEHCPRPYDLRCYFYP
jgi:hypothetical protein